MRNSINTAPTLQELVPEAPSLRDIRDGFKFTSDSTRHGVKGVLRVDSGKPGPVFGVTSHVHAGEIVGDSPLAHHLSTDTLGKWLSCGSVDFVVVHLEGARQVFDLEDFDSAASRQKRRALRCLDDDMNRLPKKVLEMRSSGSYEVERAQELVRVVRGFDAALDVHEMINSSDPDPGLIDIKGDVEALVRGVSAKTMISGLPRVQRGIPIGALYGKGSAPVAALEEGPVTSAAARLDAVHAMYACLHNLGMLRGELNITPTPRRHLVADKTIFMPDPSCRLTRRFKTFDRVEANEVFARGDHGSIAFQRPWYVLCPATPESLESGLVKSGIDELCFRSRLAA